MRRRARLIQPRVPGLVREPALAMVDPRIKAALTYHARHLNCSRSWLAHTLMADGLRINLDRPLRAPAIPRRTLRLVASRGSKAS